MAEAITALDQAREAVVLEINDGNRPDSPSLGRFEKVLLDISHTITIEGVRINLVATNTIVPLWRRRGYRKQHLARLAELTAPSSSETTTAFNASETSEIVG